MTVKIDNCQLEVDQARGVIYVHSPLGRTLLRICNVPDYQIRAPGIELIDARAINHSGAS